MDNIYKPRFPHNTRIDEKFTQFKAKVKRILDAPIANNEDLMAVMNLTEQPQAFLSLNESISMDHLSHPEDLRISCYDPANSTRRKKNPVVPLEAHSLHSISTLVAQKNLFTDCHYLRYMKYNKHRHISLDVDHTPEDIRPGEETLVVVRVYEPFM